MYLSRVNFLTGFILFYFFLLTNCQTIKNPQKFQQSLKNNLQTSLPSLFRNINSFDKLSKSGDNTVKISSKTLDIETVEILINSYSSSNLETDLTDTNDKRLSRHKRSFNVDKFLDIFLNTIFYPFYFILKPVRTIIWTFRALHRSF